jgi:methionyl aminopeptidase
MLDRMKGPILKNREEIAVMDRANRIVLEILEMMRAMIKPGVTTAQLNAMAEEELARRGAKSPFKGYGPMGLPPYPAVLCASVNDVIVHGIPSRARLELIDTTRECLELAIDEMRPGKHLGDIGAAVQEHAEEHGFHVIRNFVGHGIGRRMHEDPQVYNYGRRGRGLELRAGMVLAVEPMLCEIGSKLRSRIERAGRDGVIEDIRTDNDRWTARTIDGTLAAHFEHSIAITADGPVVLGK